MTYELLLISVVILAGYWGVFFVRRRPHGTMTFGLMQLAAAGLAGVGLLGRSHDAAWPGVAGAIGIGAACCLLGLGPLARIAARRLLAAERVGVATRLLDLAELLAPGSGVSEEKAVVRALTEIREGRIEHTVDALTAAKQRAPADARLAIDERIAMLYLAAYRWTEAIQYAETHLFETVMPDEGDGSLRRALGVAPPVWVELLGAYGRVGDLDQAAKMVARLEDVCAGRDDAALWVHRARVMFLALAGRIEAVRALVAPRQARHMTTAARTYWIAVAHEHHGDRASAAVAYAKARARSRGRPRALIDQALAALAARTTPCPALAAAAQDVVARIEAAPLPPRIRVARSRTPRATWLVTAVMFAVSAVTVIAVGHTSDIGVVIRAGGLVHGLVDDGEWWRLISSMFVHVGAVHLVLNAAALFVLGRLAEDLFGSARMLAIFAVAGVAGELASYLASSSGVSAGASGAVLGLTGAALVELVWHRERYRGSWKVGMWSRLAVITIGQLAYGLFSPLVDQWAHGAGLVAGGVLGLALSPSVRWSAIGAYAARAIALGFGAVAVVACALVVRTSLADSLAGSDGSVRRIVDGVAITVPVGWRASSDEVFQSEGVAIVKLARQRRGADDHQIATWIAETGRQLKDQLGEPSAARDTVLGVPAGWQGSELQIVVEDSLGYRQRIRVVVCGRAFGDQMIFTAVQVPETIARAAPEFFARLLASVGPA